MGVMNRSVNNGLVSSTYNNAELVPSRERKLASVQVISEINPIPGADSIEVARVLGWNVVVKKGEYQVGDKVIYCEIDSVLPKDKPEFDFLESTNWRIRTRKLRGQISQGICFPLTVLPGWGNELRSHDDIETGRDVTELLNITKFEAPIPPEMLGKMKGGFPSFIQKTDEPRVQALGHILDRYAGVEAVATEKIDGMSTTMYFRDGSFGVCSRNIELLETADTVEWQLSRKYSVREALEKENRNLAIQGETVGSGIKGNKYGFAQGERRWYVFSIFDIDKYSYLSTEEVKDFCTRNGLLQVPEVSKFPLPGNCDELVEMSRGNSVINPKIKREGIVIRSIKDIQVPEIGRLSVKAINPDFLLKYDD